MLSPFCFRPTRRALALAALGLLALTPALRAQTQPAASDHMTGPLGISHARIGSGTSWLPDSSPMHALHTTWGAWNVMFHGAATAVYNDQLSRRGDTQLGLIDWEMLMAMRRIGTGLLHLHVMTSLEPATIGARGYPLLLQTGESYRGRPLHDRQHPHDLFMELAAMYQQPVASDLALSLYAGLAGEPALGPVAYMHRPSGQSDPLAPIGHHWQDASHIMFGVLTGGVYGRRWKLEGSLFNGREPDENRWNIDLSGRKLDSYSGRLTLNPTGRLSLSGWYGYLESPEALHPDDPVRRYGASLLFSGRGWRGGEWASAVVWGANKAHGRVQHSVLAESNLELGSRTSLFGRIEQVTKSAEELVLAGVDEDAEYDLRALVLGAVREVASLPGTTLGVGVRGSLNFVPRELEPTYGTRTPKGIAVFLRLRPKRMVMQAPHDVHHHDAGPATNPSMNRP